MEEREVRKISFGDGTITIRQVDIVTEKWEVIEIQKLDLEGITNAVLRLLKGTTIECKTILIKGVEFHQGLSKEEIFQKISNNKINIESI